MTLLQDARDIRYFINVIKVFFHDVLNKLARIIVSLDRGVKDS